jgi:RimJ/RimL family protein N-acetyltransferase
MLRLTRATPADLMQWAAERRRDGFPLPRRAYKVLMAKVTVSEAYTARETADGSPVFLAGCWDLSGQTGEIWFLVRNGGLGRHMFRAHRLALRWFQEAAVHYSAFVAYVRADNRNGQRLVRALGFAPTGASACGIDEWGRPGGRHGFRVDGRLDEESASQAVAPAGAA